MSTKKQTGYQTNNTLSKPAATRTVPSPRARGKRAPNKMADSVKDKDTVLTDGKETKDDVDKESVPLSPKEAHMERKDIFRTDSTLSNGDLDSKIIPNVVQHEKRDTTESNKENSDVFNCGSQDSKNKENTKEITKSESLVANDGDIDKAEALVSEHQYGSTQKEHKTENSIKGSSTSVNSKESKSETVKSSTSTESSKELKNESVKSSAVSISSKEGKESKNSSMLSRESKSQCTKGSSVSINSKEAPKGGSGASRPSSMKSLNNKKEIISVSLVENEKVNDVLPNGLKKGIGKTKGDKINHINETKVTITDTTTDGINNNGKIDLIQNGVIQPDKISLTVPGQVMDNSDTQNKKVETRKDSIASDTLRRESTKYSMGSRKSMDLPVQYTTVQMPTTEDKTKQSVYATEDSWIRIAIPYLPVGLAVFCLLLNICVPGLGTIVSGFSIFCCAKSRVPPKYDQDLLVILCVNIWVGVAQLFTVSFLLVGWFWSLAWGIKMVILAVERRQELKDQRAKELQTLALKAFGSSIPAAHITPIT